MLYVHYCLFINRLMIFDEGEYCIANHTIAAIEALKWDDVRDLIRYQKKLAYRIGTIGQEQKVASIIRLKPRMTINCLFNVPTTIN